MVSGELEACTSQIGNLLQFLSWVGERRRTYEETMGAWKTSCPRLAAWEDATSAGLVDIERTEGIPTASAIVVLTKKGAVLLNDKKVEAARHNIQRKTQ